MAFSIVAAKRALTASPSFKDHPFASSAKSLQETTFVPSLAQIFRQTSRGMQSLQGAIQKPAARASYTEPRQDDGPMRFLKFAAGAGAATAALGAASWAVKKQRESPAHVQETIDAAIAAGAPPSSAAGGHTYTVQKGDTITSIAHKHDTLVEVIRTMNNLKSDTINAGQQIWIPKTYTIQKGDGLLKIAHKFNTTIEQLQKLNSISNPDLIYAGDVLLVP